MSDSEWIAAENADEQPDTWVYRGIRPDVGPDPVGWLTSGE